MTYSPKNYLETNAGLCHCRCEYYWLWSVPEIGGHPCPRLVRPVSVSAIFQKNHVRVRGFKKIHVRVRVRVRGLKKFHIRVRVRVRGLKL